METATAQIETSKENETPSATMNTDFSSDHALGGILEGTTLVEYEGMGDGGVDISIPEEKEDESELRVEEEDEEGIPNPEPESPAVTIVHALQLSSPQQLADTEQHQDPDQQQDTEPADRNVTLQLSEATHFILTSLDYVSKRLQGVEVRVDGVEGRMVGSERVVEGGTARERETAFCVPFERKGDFGGREEEIGSLMGRWRKGDRARVGVVGLGGIGKTDLVLEFVYRLKHIASTTPIFWFRPEDICTNERVPSTAAAGTQLDEWIKAEYSSDCVLVVDTGDNFHPIIMHPKRLLDKLDGFAGTLVLVARSAYDVRQLAGLHGIYEVPALDLSAATTIFKRQLNTFAQSTTTYAQLQEVCHLLTCNPRGLIQIAPTINQTGLKVSQFLELYQKSDSNKLRLFSTLVPVVTATHSDQAVFGKGVFDMAAFRSSFPDAPSKMLYQLYYLGATSIPKSIFSAMDALEMIFALHILLSHHLLSEDIATQTLTLHPLVYLTLHSHLRRRHTLETSSSVLQHQTWHEETILLFSRRYPDAKVENRSWWKDTFTHLLTNLPLHSDALKTAISTIYHREAAFFKRRGMYTEALKMAVLSRNALPESVPGTMVHILQSHAALLEKLGRYRELQNTLEKFDRDVDVEKGGMVWIWRERVRARLAVHLEPGDNHAVSFGVFMSTDLANAEKYDSALRQHDLAGVLMLRGAYREAEIAARQALMERERSVGSEHANMLTSCHYLAEISLLGGKFEQGMGYVHTAIVGREKVLGLAHPETVLSRALNGRILLSRAVTLLDLAEAEQVIEGSRERLASVLGAKHPTVLATQQDIGTSMMRRGDYTSAEHLFSSVLKAREEFWGLEQNNHPEILASRHALAELTFLKDGPETAETMVETLVKQRTTALGESHPSTLDSTLLQARIFSAISKHDLAREAIESVVRHCSIFLSSTHPSTALASSHRAEILRVSFTTPSCATPPLQPELCLAKEITALSSRAYTMLAHLYGSEHHLALQAATHLALALSPPHLSDAHSGLGSTHAFRHIYTAYFRSLGKMHPETLQAQVRLGEALGTAALRAGSSSIGVRIDKELVEEARHHWREGLSGLGSENWVAERAWRRFEGFIGELERRSGNERVLGVKVERKEEGIEWKGEMEWEGESRKGETVTGRGT